MVHGSPHWDKDVQPIVVTHCDQKAMELRAWVSAASGPLSWNIRVETRQKAAGRSTEELQSKLAGTARRNYRHVIAH